jgi:spore germination protein GerM
MLVSVIKGKIKPSPETAGSEQRQEQLEITAQPASPAEQEKPREGSPSEQTPAISAQTPPSKPPEKEPETAPNAGPQDQPQTEKPATSTQPSTPTVPVSTPPVRPAETRGSIYLIQESNKMLVKVNRNFNATTPLTDSINALLAGPTPDEIMRGVESFVPEGSRLLKTPTIIGSTVRLDFNQEFRYNSRGREGCEAQIKQIVWTVTEFPNVQNVQFLIEGNIVDFLSEGVAIRNPIGR